MSSWRNRPAYYDNHGQWIVQILSRGSRRWRTLALYNDGLLGRRFDVNKLVVVKGPLAHGSKLTLDHAVITARDYMKASAPDDLFELRLKNRRTKELIPITTLLV